jgi:hypothetical protein
MKFVLAAMCALVVLFMGGCAVLALAAGPLALLPAGVALLNLLIIGALYGWKLNWRPAFYILGIADLVIVAAILAIANSTTMGISTSDAPMLWGLAIVFLLKGILTLVYAGQRAASS